MCLVMPEAKEAIRLWLASAIHGWRSSSVLLRIIASREESEAGQLARDLFDSDSGHGARVLLLSATPYRGLSLHHETDDDHYADFLALIRCLEYGDADGFKMILAEYRSALPAVMTIEGLARLRNAKEALEQRLRRV